MCLSAVSLDLDTDGLLSISSSDVLSSISDNCTLNPLLSISPDNFDCSNAGTVVSVQVSAADDAGSPLGTTGGGRGCDRSRCGLGQPAPEAVDRSVCTYSVCGAVRANSKCVAYARVRAVALPAAIGCPVSEGGLRSPRRLIALGRG